MSRVLGGDGQPGCGESLVDVLVDGVECGAEFGWGLGLVGGEEGGEDAVVDLGVEQREAQPVGGEVVGLDLSRNSVLKSVVNAKGALPQR